LQAVSITPESCTHAFMRISVLSISVCIRFLYKYIYIYMHFWQYHKFAKSLESNRFPARQSFLRVLFLLYLAQYWPATTLKCLPNTVQVPNKPRRGLTKVSMATGVTILWYVIPGHLHWPHTGLSNQCSIRLGSFEGQINTLGSSSWSPSCC